MTLTEAFSGLPDTRKGPAVKYVLSEIMIMAICAILCGANNWIETTDWYKDRQKWLKERFGFTDVPHPRTIRLAASFLCWMPPYSRRAFVSGSTRWPGLLRESWRLTARRYEGPARKCVMNGCTGLRRRVLCLAQEGTCGKGHELAGIKALLDVLILKGCCIVTMDALGGQKEIAEKIVDRGGDYVLQVKDNQKNLADALREFFEQGEEEKRRRGGIWRPCR